MVCGAGEQRHMKDVRAVCASSGTFYLKTQVGKRRIRRWAGIVGAACWDVLQYLSTPNPDLVY